VEEGRALEEGIWFAVPDDTKTPYGYDRAWHVWDKDGDSDLKSFWIRSQEDADALIRLLQQVKADLPADDQTDFEKNVVIKYAPPK
jgi:hypothetical protein